MTQLSSSLHSEIASTTPHKPPLLAQGTHQRRRSAIQQRHPSPKQKKTAPPSQMAVTKSRGPVCLHTAYAQRPKNHCLRRVPTPKRAESPRSDLLRCACLQHRQCQCPRLRRRPGPPHLTRSSKLGCVAVCAAPPAHPPLPCPCRPCAWRASPSCMAAS